MVDLARHSGGIDRSMQHKHDRHADRTDKASTPYSVDPSLWADWISDLYLSLCVPPTTRRFYWLGCHLLCPDRRPDRFNT